MSAAERMDQLNCTWKIVLQSLHLYITEASSSIKAPISTFPLRSTVPLFRNLHLLLLLPGEPAFSTCIVPYAELTCL